MVAVLLMRNTLPQNWSGRYKAERKGLAAIALTTDTSALTAIGNDYGYDRVFDRQVEALANTGDVAIGISTGGSIVPTWLVRLNWLKTWVAKRLALVVEMVVK